MSFKTKKPTLKELNSDLFSEQVSGPNFYGNPHFGGTGNFGRGGYRQLAGGLSGPTKDLEDQEQAEINQNIDDQSWILGKYELGGEKTGTLVPPRDGRNGQVGTVAEEAIAEQTDKDTVRIYHITTVENWPKIQASGQIDPAFSKGKEVEFAVSRKAVDEVLDTAFWAARRTKGYVVLVLDVPKQLLSSDDYRNSIVGHTKHAISLKYLVDTEEVPKPEYTPAKRDMLRKFLGPNHMHHDIDLEEQAPYDNATTRMRDLPGFPAPNTLVEPKNFVPANAPPDEENPVTGEKARYLGPTLNGIPLEINDDQTDKFLDALLGQEAPPEDTGREPPEEESRDLILHDFLDEVINELLGAPKATYPNRQGWNNKQINALAWRKNQLDPQEPPPEMWRHLFKEPKGSNPGVDDNPYTLKGEPNPAQESPMGTFGAIGFPKQFVPQDYETANPDYEGFAQDPIGTRRLTSPPSSTDPRLGVHPSISEAIKALVQEALKELK